MHPKSTMRPCAQCGTPFRARTRAGKPQQNCGWECLEASRTPEGRFWAKVDKDGPVPEACPELGPCWCWIGALFTDSGYGQFWLDDTNRRAHIVSYEWAIGPTDGQQVQHLCNVRTCVRPSHLILGTAAGNMQYASQTGRMASGDRHWTRNQPDLRRFARGEGQGNAKLTEADVREIRRLYAAGVRQIDLARRFNVNPVTIWMIVHQKTWTHVE